MRKHRLLLCLSLVLIGILLIGGSAYAQWVVTAVPNSWDDAKNRWENGNLVMYLDGTAQPFYYPYFPPGQDEFNNDPVADACGVGTTTTFAGTGAISLYHTDTGGEPGFQSTANWSLVSCAALEGPPDKKYPDPGDILATCTSDNGDGVIDRCEIITKDVVDGSLCGGNCQDQIVTTLRVNMDLDCNGNPDAGFADDVCLYWEAEKPPNQAPYWQGNVQVRIAAGGGDKTLNFSLAGPNAITLRTLDAEASGTGATTVAAGLLGLLALAAAVVIYRRLPAG